MNQRLLEVEGVDQIFVYPNMGDGGCGTGAALLASAARSAAGPIDNIYYGPSYSEAEIAQALEARGLSYRRPRIWRKR